MNPATLVAQFGPYAATLIVAFLSGLIPFLNLELYLVAVAAITPGSHPLWSLGAVAGFGQILAKSLMFWGGGAAARRRAERNYSQDRIERLRRRMAAMNPWVLLGTTFVSALVGVPPFFLVSILAGALGMNFWLFFLTGLIGRCLRLILIVESPHAIMGLFR
jgi:membrane protein YqaA with SNARE-associated domain